MFTREGRRLALSIATVAISMTGCAATSPMNASTPARYGLGSTPTPAQIAGWNIDVSPEGGGLPAGAGSVAQGAALFAAKCVACHGATGEGGPGGQLVGGAGTLATAKPVRTIGSFWPYATTVYDYIHRAMPWDKPGSLAPNEVYALTAYLLNRNGILPADAVLHAATLAQVKMPNRAGFTSAQTKDDVVPTRCMERCKP